MITQRQALEDFILNRVLGDEGFALGEDGYCTYSHKVNGGCAIGKWLREEDAEILEESASSPLVIKAMYKAEMEEPEHKFWWTLQQTHDYLAQGIEDWGDMLKEAAAKCL